LPTLQIIIASTRPQRLGGAVGDWLIERAGEHGKFELDVADLAEIDLPMFDEPHHPRLAKYTQRHTQAWSARVAAADAFAFVTPEYNYGPAPSLINALTYLNREWQYKPAGFVSYGGVAAGTRGVQMAKQVMTTLKIFPLFEAVSIPFVKERIDDDGKLVANEIMDDAATVMLDELLRVEAAMRQLRS
jgi:NAD(P)H-dependent FMN reductase